VVRTRLIVAFIVVALVSALVSAWFVHVVLPYYHYDLPGWLADATGSQVVRSRPVYPAAPHAAVAIGLIGAAVLLAAITGVAYAASRRVLRPVRRLAQAAQRMSGGDLSVRIQSQGRDELARLVTSFNTMAASLEDKVGELQRMETRARQFAGDVSHELRTPLTAMTAVADMLGEHPGLDEDTAAAARLVRQEIFHLGRLVEDLIEISRFDAGTAQLVIDDTDIGTAVSGCLKARRWTDVGADVPAGLTARLDRRRFDVIVANLVGNALRHGSPPVTVTARAQQQSRSGGYLALEVRDHGPGLPAAAIPKVFDRFYKADIARARSEGSGLGLAIAWENARLHGGHIEAGNHPGGGAVFTVILPLNGHCPISRRMPQAVPGGP
jgi:two-component system, OmpR family, sensor histidine kinase MtrB